MSDWLIWIAQCFFHLIAIIVHRVSPEILYIFYSFKIWGHLGNSNSKPKDPNTSYRSKKSVYFLCAPGTSFLRWYPVAPFFAPGKKQVLLAKLKKSSETWTMLVSPATRWFALPTTVLAFFRRTSWPLWIRWVPLPTSKRQRRFAMWQRYGMKPRWRTISFLGAEMFEEVGAKKQGRSA